MRLTYTHVTVILVVVVAFTILFLQLNNQNQVCFEDHCFNVELAITQEEREKGLMFREELDPNKGVLFVLEEEGYYSFWMKDTLIPLDIIWIDRDREVVFISENAQPCGEGYCPSIMPDKKAKYVLEINAGSTERIGLNVGDKLDFRLNIDLEDV